MNRPTRIAQQGEDVQYADQTVDQPSNLPAEREQDHSLSAGEASSPAHAAMPTTGFAKLASAIALVMAEIKPVEKEGWNDFHKYQYAKMQDLSRELTPLMGKHGIVIFQTEEGREMFDNGAAIAVRYRFTIVHKSGEIWPEHPIQTGLSACRANNGKFDDKAINKCHTSARKYFLLSLFQIPTDDGDDADGSSGNQQQSGSSRPRRQVPGPGGKVRPHIIAVVPGELPAAWADRFIAFINKAESDSEIDEWYNVNGPIMEKIKGHQDGGQELLDSIVDAMDARATTLTSGNFAAAAEKPAEVVKPAAPARTAPTRTPPKPKDDGLDIPPALRRTPTKTTSVAAIAPSIEDVEAFFEFMAKRIGDAPDMDAVQIVWDTFVEPYIDGRGHRDNPKILPPDLDALDDLVNQRREQLGI